MEDWGSSRDGQNHHMLMILKSKSNHLNKGDLNSIFSGFHSRLAFQIPCII